MKSGERFCGKRSVLDQRRDARFYYEFTNDWGVTEEKIRKSGFPLTFFEGLGKLHGCLPRLNFTSSLIAHGVSGQNSNLLHNKLD